jgi:hypothetical protein
MKAPVDFVRIRLSTGAKAIAAFEAFRTQKAMGRVPGVSYPPNYTSPPAPKVTDISGVPDPAVAWGNDVEFRVDDVVVSVLTELDGKPNATPAKAFAAIVARNLAKGAP